MILAQLEQLTVQLLTILNHHLWSRLIIVQPGNISAITGDDITLTLTATCDEPIGYQWWKSPFVSVIESKITNNEKYSGATTNTLTIRNVSASDAEVKYLCEVYNSNDHSNLWVNSNPGSITIAQSSGYV